MAKSYTTKSGLIINRYYNELDVESFSLMMKDPSACYKFYWLEAIVKLIVENVEMTTFDDIIDEMISNAWYSVCEYHLHLSGVPADGKVKDALEKCVTLLAHLSKLPTNASKTEIKNAIKIHNKKLKSLKTQLTNYVPYKALSSFLDTAGVTFITSKKSEKVDAINLVNSKVMTLPYIFEKADNLSTVVYFQDSWIDMIKDNAVSILGWIQNEKIKWLQRVNPEVPGIVYKLEPLDNKIRKLKDVHKLWDAVMKIADVRDIYNDDLLNGKKYDVDHFIPWSFVMNDELWNLVPMDPPENTRKSNLLPNWSKYFGRFSDRQYLLYTSIYSNKHIEDLFRNCFKDNLHSIWAYDALYKKGNDAPTFKKILNKNMRPVYDSANRQGYGEWKIINCLKTSI